MTFTTVRECPSAEETWHQRAKICTRSDHYHCLLNEDYVLVEGCINPRWEEPGNCPVYNSKAFKLDAQNCRTHVCPNGVYRSNDLYKYNGCFTPKRASESPFSLSVDESTQQNKTTQSIPSRPGTSSSVTAVVLPIILILVLLGVIAAAFVWYRRKRCRGQSAPCSDKESENRLKVRRIFTCFCKQKNNLQQQTEKEESLEQKEKLLGADCPSSRDDKQNDNPENFTRAELLTEMNIKIEEFALKSSPVSPLANSLLNTNTLALIGEWGSGKRRLAVQTALELEKVVNENVQFKVFHYFDEMCEPGISGISLPTVFILPDLYKFWCTDHHIEDVIKVLISIRSIAKDKKLYIIASFTENAWTSFTRFFRNGNIAYLFPETFCVSSSSETWIKIAEKNRLVLKDKEINEIQSVKSIIGKPLITVLYCQNPACRNPEFLKNPLRFIMSDLRGMRDSSDVDDRMKFQLLVYTMFHGGKVEEKELENYTDHPLFEEINTVKDKRDYIKGCVTKLRNGYMEKISAGNSYRMLHDVITKCVFLAAAEKEPELMFKECDFLLLLDCIRPKSNMEKIWEKGQYSFDYNALNMGIPTDSFPMVARIFKERNEIMPMLRKVKLFSDIGFQIVWNYI